MRKLAFCIAIILCLVLIMPVAGGCSEPEEENTFVKLLSLLPATAKDNSSITLIDYERFYKVNGISIYDENGQRIKREEYLNILGEMVANDTLSGDSWFGLNSFWTYGGSFMSSAPIQDKYTGYEVTDACAEIHNIFTAFPGLHVSDNRTDFLVTAVGEYSVQSTEAALNNRDEWPSRLKENYETEDYNGIIIHSWGDSQEVSLADRLKPPHVDNIGRAMPIAVSDRQLFVSDSVKGVELMIDTRQNKVDSLADIPEYVKIAESMHELGAIAVMIADELLLRDFLELPEQYSGLPLGPQLNNFQTVGMGLGKDEKGIYMALVLIYDIPVLAEEGAKLLEQKVEAYNILSEWISKSKDAQIYDTEIRFENEVLLAKLYSEQIGLWRWWFFDQWWVISLGYD